MEIKKSAKADLERKRPRWFLMGLFLATAAFIVTLEMPWPRDVADDAELIEILDDDIELAPLLNIEHEKTVLPPSKPEPSTSLTVVEDTPEEADEEEEPEPQPDQPMEGDVIGEKPVDGPEPPASDKLDEPFNFRVVEDVPQFPGGHVEFMKWLTRNLKYPKAVETRRQQGMVLTEFIVNRDGSITDVRIARSLCKECDEEALRVLRMMPRWQPGVMNDKPCRTKVCIPIVFKL